jgi:hypothetical protein
MPARPQRRDIGVPTRDPAAAQPDARYAGVEHRIAEDHALWGSSGGGHERRDAIRRVLAVGGDGERVREAGAPRLDEAVEEGRALAAIARPNQDPQSRIAARQLAEELCLGD